MRAHGDGKSSTGGKCWTEAMKSSQGTGQVQSQSETVKQGKAVVMSFEMPGMTEPSAHDVVSEMQ